MLSRSMAYELMCLVCIVLLLPVVCVDGSNADVEDNYISDGTVCPTDCTCSPNTKGPRLVIDCGRRTNSSQLADEVDRLINSISSKLTDLTITNSPLTAVPKSVCVAVKLTYLNLASNKLSSLREKCVSNLLKLEDFSARNNELTELQNDVFKGLANLLKLDLSRNHISKIELNTFTEEAGLTRLNDINLDYNKLTSLEPWPFIRGQLVPLSTVSVFFNQIIVFTNELNWSYRCGMKPLEMTLTLEKNAIEHMIDLFNGWNITGLGNTLCLFGTFPFSALKLYFDHNPLVCDCQDYVMYSLVHYFQHIQFMVDLFCDSPPALFNRKIMSVPLEEFVCEIPSPCPVGCRCIKRPYNKTLVVTCNTLTSLPVLLPNTSYPPPYKTRYMLQFKGSFLDTVGYHDYFSETYSLDVSQSSVTHVTDEAWRALMQLPVVDLSANNLTVLPPILPMMNSTIKSLSLYNNQWRCECGDRWMRDWLVSLGMILQSPQSMLCNSPDHMRTRSILLSNDDDFCYDPEREKILTILKIVVPTVMGSVLVVLTITTALYRWRFKAFIHLRLHPFDIDECEGDDMIYDVFLSYANEDREVVQRIVNRLEGISGNSVDSSYDTLLPHGGYRVCYHERDFIPGDLILENIQRAIERSRRVICLVTRDFISSKYCMMEFRGAWSHHTRMKKRRLVVVKWPEVDFFVVADRDTEMDLKLFLSTHTYVDRGTTDWWYQLIYALPIHGLPRTIDSIPDSRDDVLSEAPSREHLLADGD